MMLRRMVMIMIMMVIMIMGTNELRMYRFMLLVVK